MPGKAYRADLGASMSSIIIPIPKADVDPIQLCNEHSEVVDRQGVKAYQQSVF
jgi:hypothetical protein